MGRVSDHWLPAVLKQGEVGAGIAEMALVAKAADRLANVLNALEEGNQSLLKMYTSEQATFRAAAHRPGLCDDLWERLDLAFASSPKTKLSPR